MQVQGMEQHGASDHDAMYANGFPDVGFDQDASVHLKDVRSHIAALKVRPHICSDIFMSHCGLCELVQGQSSQGRASLHSVNYVLWPVCQLLNRLCVC